MGFRMSYMIHKAVVGAVRGGDNKKKKWEKTGQFLVELLDFAD